MLIYCSHEYGGDPANIKSAGKIIRKLQMEDPENCYVSPLHCFSFMEYDDLTYEECMELCFDLLCACDEMLVLSQESEGVKREIEMANKIGMEVNYFC